ncbi:MAG: diguanylate cyclase [Deltaproteobacteria bacterium]|nr:diguanylate cyclase [Deltaproteobacteria bacterium]
MRASSAIILIDPIESSREVLTERLKMQGYVVTACAGPAEGAHLALSNPPAAVIADLWMPSISGLQLCRLLKAEPATRAVPVVLRGPEGHRNHFWAERAGASAFVAKGRMGDLVRALCRAIQDTPEGDAFFCQLPSETMDIRDRIASYLDAALLEAVIASDIRALSLCGAFDRLFDLFTQFVCQVVNYRWLALQTDVPNRFALHTHPGQRSSCEAEARAALQVPEHAPLFLVEDEDALDAENGQAPETWPVNFLDTVIGKLVIAAKEPLQKQDQELLAVIARELGGPIRMATLVEEAQRMATRDPLTGLMNRRAFQASLVIELERAVRQGFPMSLLLLDVDHFKAINDKRGHASGDAVLAALGKLLACEARKVDLVARWGGEEFVIALSGTNLLGGMVAAERIRLAIEKLPVNDGHAQAIPVTASIGLAMWQPGESIDALMDRADRAMYTAKCSGRNRVKAEDKAE